MTNTTESSAPIPAEVERPRGSAIMTSDSGGDAGVGTTNWPMLIGLIGLFALLWMAGPRYFLVVVGLIVMIFLHELGHFVTAKWTGMKSTQFFIGFGPTIWSFRRGEVEYGIKAIPAGAFVRIIGMNNLDPVPPEDEPRAYRSATYPRRMLVITAGSIMHFIQAVVLFVMITSFIGFRDSESSWEISQLSQLDDGSPAPAITAGLEVGDRIVSVDGRETVPFTVLSDYLRSKPGEEVTLVIERDSGGTTETIETTTQLAIVPQSDGSEIGFLGVGPLFDRTTEGPVRGLEIFGENLWEAMKAIPRFFGPDSLGNLGTLVFDGREEVALDSDEAAERPISMVGAVRVAGNPDFDWVTPLVILASINVFVGVINLVPLLPLDGGHAAVATYERLRSRKDKPYRADVAKLMPLTYAVVLLFAFIFFTTVWLDIARPIS